VYDLGGRSDSEVVILASVVSGVVSARVCVFSAHATLVVAVYILDI
jgi:hypothetical protein